ncbi:Uncharacterised protein [BD1-7 clade bacterium]|uniref:Outer membrane protein beta-barrel domain-containing protein n=1 Tax=BD1-7 clade bacterium TaxID=2029982 RepID=A0A5S9PL09_9GAMM|nr:Uncharacterised protein [BD1-7 clade bacterium]
MAINRFVIPACFALFCGPGGVSLSQAEEKHHANHDFQFNVNTEYLAQGDFSVLHSGLAGVEFQYNFLHANDWHLFVKGGYQYGFGSDTVGLDIFTADFGAQYDLVSFWCMDLLAEASVGAAYSIESFENRFINGTVEHSFSELDPRGSAGLGIGFAERFQTKFIATQTGSKATSVGLSFSVSF